MWIVDTLVPGVLTYSHQMPEMALIQISVVTTSSVHPFRFLERRLRTFHTEKVESKTIINNLFVLCASFWHNFGRVRGCTT